MKLRQISEGWLQDTPWDEHESDQDRRYREEQTRKWREEQDRKTQIAYDRSRNTIRYNNKLAPVVFISASNVPVQQDHIFIVSGADVDTVRNALFEYDVEIDDIKGFQSYYGSDLNDLDPEEWDAKVVKIEFKDLEPTVAKLFR